MKNTILFIALIQLAVLPSVAFAACTHAVGDVVKMLSPAMVAEQMSELTLVKDEFETTEEFNARQKATLEQAPNGTIVVEATYDPEYAKYDADAERFLIERWAWHNIGGRFDDSVPSVSSYERDLHAIGLQHVEQVIDTYKGSNAYGKEVDVAKILRNVYGLFDKKATKGAKTWIFDFKESGNYADGTNKAPGVFLPVPRAQAKALKTDMRFGIAFTPKKPFLFKGKGYYGATTDRPTEIDVEVSSISGDIECAVITDAKGTVLKIVETAY